MNNKVKSFFVLPLYFGFFSLVMSYFLTHVLVYSISYIPHYAYTKEGTYPALLSMFLGFPSGVVLYFLLFYIKAMKKKLSAVTLILFFILSFFTITEFVNGSCLSLRYRYSIDKGSSLFQAWSTVCN